MARTNTVSALPLQTFDTTTFVAGFNLFYTLPFPTFFLAFKNRSDHDVYVSYDGINSHAYLQADQRIARYFQSNSRPANDVALLPKGTRIYLLDDGGLKGGNIYLSGWHYTQG